MRFPFNIYLIFIFYIKSQLPVIVIRIIYILFFLFFILSFSSSFSQTLTIGNNGSYSSPSSETYDGLSLGNSASLTVNSGHTLTINGNATSNNGFGITVQENATLIITGTLTGNNNITLTVSGVIIVGGISINNGGTLTVGGTGEITVNGDFTSGTGATIDIDGSMTVDGNLDLGSGSTISNDGTLSVSGEYTGPDVSGEGETTLTYTIGTGTLIETSGGSGATYQSYLSPFSTYWKDGRHAYLYLKSEIEAVGGAEGNITSIGFNVVTSYPISMNGFTVKIKHIPVATTTISDYQTTSLDICYSGSYSVVGTGWQTIELDDPFSWDGINNLYIEICYDNTTSTSTSTVRGTNLGSGVIRNVYGVSDSGSGCSISKSGTNRVRPNIRLTIGPSSSIWTGSTSTAWTTASNWSSGSVPTSSSKIIIPVVTNQPVITANLTIASLTVDAGADITISSDTLTVSGVFDLNGTMNIDNATVSADGNFDATGGSIDFTNTAGKLILSSTVTSLGTLDDAMGTVEYDGATQTVLADSYFNLSIATAGTKTAGGNLDVNGDLTTAATATCALDMVTHNLTVAGNLTVGTIDGLDLSDASCLVTIDGIGDQTLTHAGVSSGAILNDLTINKSSGKLILSSEISVNGALTFTSAVIDASSNNLVLTADASVSGACDASHVIGSVAKTTTSTSPFTFPVGDGTNYRSIAITPTNTSATTWRAQYNNTQYSSLDVDLSLDHVSSLEYWDLDRIAGTESAAITLSWDANSGDVITHTDLVVAHFDGTNWENAGGNSHTGNNTAGTVVSNDAWDTYSPFTIGTTNPGNALPVIMTDFNGSCQTEYVHVFWQTASEMNCSHFDVERSKDGFQWEVLGSIHGNGNSTSIKSYDWLDYTSRLDVRQKPVYYRLRQVDFDGKEDLFSPISVFCDEKPETKIELYPNPTRGFTTLFVNKENKDESAHLILSDITGKILFQQSINLSKGGIELNLDLTDYQNGVYNITVVSSTNECINQRLIKQ